jgi:hypothetical protein
MLKADHLSAPDEDPFDRRNDMVEFGDEVASLLTATADGSDYWLDYLPFQSTADRELFNAKLNQVEATITEVIAGRTNLVKLDLKTNYPNYLAFWISEVDERSQREIRSWRVIGPSFTWKPRRGSRLEVRAIGQEQRPGPAAVIKPVYDYR